MLMLPKQKYLILTKARPSTMVNQSRWNKNGQVRWDIANVGRKKPTKAPARNKDGSPRKKSRQQIMSKLKTKTYIS